MGAAQYCLPEYAEYIYDESSLVPSELQGFGWMFAVLFCCYTALMEFELRGKFDAIVKTPDERVEDTGGSNGAAKSQYRSGNYYKPISSRSTPQTFGSVFYHA